MAKFKLKIANNLLQEAQERLSMTNEEIVLRNRLIRLLQQDKHSVYADLLKLFTINIVPVNSSITTAANDGRSRIYINRGFLTDASTFSQLSVVVRHEMAHQLLNHFIRTYKYFGNIGISNFKESSSLWEMANIVEDCEISNRKYFGNDKDTIKALKISGKVVHGIITEEHMEDWAQLPLEQMYDSFLDMCEEAKAKGLEAIYNAYSKKLDTGEDTSLIPDLIAKTTYYRYNTPENKTSFYSIDNFVDYQLAPARMQNPKVQLPKSYQDIINNLTKAHDADSKAFDAQVDTWIDAINNSAPDKRVNLDLNGNTICTVTIPEKKAFAKNILLILAGRNSYDEDYATWYQQVKELIKKYNLTEDEVRQILSRL